MRTPPDQKWTHFYRSSLIYFVLVFTMATTLFIKGVH
jgi:hypothetical protein